MLLTGDLIEAYQRNYLKVENLSEWAMSLVESGIDSEGVVMAASCNDLSWEEVNRYFRTVMKELKISDNLDINIQMVKQKVFLEEYKQGKRLGGELLHKFDSLRKEIEFYDMVGLTILGDDCKGAYKSGYHTLDRKLYGDELEKEIREHLKRSGKV